MCRCGLFALSDVSQLPSRRIFVRAPLSFLAPALLFSEVFRHGAYEFERGCRRSLGRRRGFPWQNSSITITPIMQLVLVILIATVDRYRGTTRLAIAGTI